MEVKVLGALEATVNGESIAPTADKPRQLLALLALSANQVLPAAKLMEELWGEDLPRSATTTLQTYILRIRRNIDDALGANAVRGSKEILATRNGGYLMDALPGSVDALEYERFAVAGRRAFDRGEDDTAVRLFRQGLALWRGPALVDTCAGRFLGIEATRLEESRLGDVECRIEAELRLGLHAELAAELTTLIARHPLHEGLHAQCMVALYRAGRPARALSAYAALRRNLVKELGIDPSPRLRNLHCAILGGDPVLDGHDTTCRRVLDLFVCRGGAGTRG
ncbi:AfsR/SARP family transcriptional regulator [Streptomyces violascens]|uniref:AfsR/SARP family transcriptional regulator n=1 Tax=Streptomyces violascens TaxID=67381 RepID=UPI0036607383